MRNGLWIAPLVLAFFVAPELNAQVTLPESGRLAGPLDPATSRFGDEFFNFPVEMGASPRGDSALSGWIEITFGPPDGNLVDFFLDFDSVGSDEQITFGGGQTFLVANNRVWSNPFFPSRGTLDLVTREIVALEVNPLAQNTTIAPVARDNRIPFAFAASYPPPDLAALGIPPELVPPELFEPGFLFVEAAFRFAADGRITGFQFSGQTAVLSGLLAQLNPILPPQWQLFPAAAFGPNAEMYFTPPWACEPQATFCPTYEDHPDGITLPPDVFFRPHTSLASRELREVDAQRLEPSCLPASGARGVLAAAGDRLYYVGGVDGTNAATGATRIYDPESGQWSAGPAMTVPVKDAQGAAIGSKVYVYGGRRARGGIVDRLQILDTVTGTWSQGPRGMVRLAGGVAAAVGERLYVFGGRTPKDTMALKHNDAVLVYSPADGWEHLWIDPPFLREGAMAVAVGDEIYLLGGRRVHPTTGVRRVTANVVVFDTARDVFVQGPKMLWGVYEGVAGVVGGRLSVIGGRRGQGGASLAEVQTLKIGEGPWRRALPMPFPVADAAGARLGDRIFVAGGRNFPSRSELPPTSLAAAQAFDPARGWSVCGSQPLCVSDSLSNSASLTAGPQPVAPGSLAVLAGYNFGDDPAAIAIEVDGQPAAVLSVMANRVDFQVPAGVVPGTASLTVTRAGSPPQAHPVPVPIAGVAPGIFVESYGEMRERLYLDNASAIACNAAGTLNHASDPAGHGEAVTLRATGLGAAPSPADVLVYLDGTAVVPDAMQMLGPGVFGITWTVPEGARTANRVPLWIEVAGVASNRAALAVGEVVLPRPLPCP